MNFEEIINQKLKSIEKKFIFKFPIITNHSDQMAQLVNYLYYYFLCTYEYTMGTFRTIEKISFFYMLKLNSSKFTG